METLVGARVLVTGAYGLLGGWLTRSLVHAGARVTVIKRDLTTASVLELMHVEPDVTVAHGDITAEGFVARVIAEYEIDTVFHLAAQTLVPTANRAPLSTFETNIRGTWLVLEACRTLEVARVIVAASDKAYGSHTDLPYRESHALAPLYPYDVSKAATDMLARSYWHTYRLPVAVTRFANIYGGGDFNASRLIPEAVTAALAGRSPIIRSDGSPERDFLYVDDAVSAYLAIAQALGRGQIEPGEPERSVTNAAGEAFNAGSGSSHSVAEVVSKICELAGTGVVPEIHGTGTPAGEIDRQWVDHTKLTEATGWRPLVGLDEGLAATLAWYRSYG